MLRVRFGGRVSRNVLRLSRDLVPAGGTWPTACRAPWPPGDDSMNGPPRRRRTHESSVARPSPPSPVLRLRPGAPAAAGQTPGAHLGDLTWPEAEARLMDAPLVVVPFGAGAKEHGPHLPMATDRLMLEHLMQAAVDSLPVLVAPPILHGWFAAFGDFPGTGITDPDVFRRYVEEVARSLVKAGARRIVFLNTGISHSTGLPIAIAAREIHAHDHVPTLVVSWDDLETPELDAMAAQKTGGHADELETSVVLALRPDLVHMERAPTDYGKPTGDPGPGTGRAASPARPAIRSTPPRGSSATPPWPRPKRADGWWPS